jgi:predicted transcriptional regulator
MWGSSSTPTKWARLGVVATLYMQLDDDLHRRLRVAAAMNDETIKSLVARAVEREVERIEAESRRRRR